MNRSDSVDALMYAYYEFMRKKEENHMLEKNKDYIEMTPTETHTTKRGGEFLSFEIRGFADDDSLFAVPSHMSGITLDYTKPVVIVSKEKFERLQTRADSNAELAKQWEINYKLLLDKIGFDTVEELVNYLDSEAECDTLREAMSSLAYSVKFARDERRSLSKKLDECEKDYISERDKAEALEKEIEVYSHALQEWKDVTGYPSPSAVKTALESGASWCHAYNEVKETNEKLADNIKSWQEATGCDTPDKARNSIANMVDSKETTIYLGDVHNVIAKWQKVTGFDSPKAFLKWKTNIEGIIEAWKSGTGCKYPAEARILLEKWKVLTKCETPEAAATWITSYEKACERGNELAEGAGEREKEWQDATGCIAPEAAKQYIERLKGRLNKIHGYPVDR